MVVMTGLMTEGFKRARALPVLDRDLADGLCRPDLADDCHQDQVGPFPLICLARNDHRRPLLGLGLIGEGKGTSTMSPNG